ncbi:hypothetical protein F4561_002655 [Lipingzhangella halophila]|uniref:Uncharacterized protein n=1 Tax=Lipingzhangella halophila TaxID=1783352 RepID=A0A7W7RH81_9ACTN|nr:hypothetical protein [Lipingzhangella halophila]MBB4931835.1 hypothetical protein [Lipingzhangella halophila]
MTEQPIPPEHPEPPDPPACGKALDYDALDAERLAKYGPPDE